MKVAEASSGEEILPVFWDDNYFALFPGEKREIRVAYPRKSGGATPVVEVEAWNVTKSRH
ncbi:MAG: glycoside hydrolase family 2 protein [Vicinamibacteria bacterium]